MVSAAMRRLIATAGVLAMALSGLVLAAALSAESQPMAFALAVGLAVAPVPLYLALLLRLDRYEPEPARTVGFAFLWGATVAALAALIINTVGIALVGGSLGGNAAEVYGGSISAPLVEETAKAAVIYGLYRFNRAEFDGVLDGIVYAGCVGLGFAMTENVIYYGQGAAADGVPGALATFVVRGLLSPFVHPLFTAATGIGLGLAAQTRRPAVRMAAPWAGLATAVALHSLWNTAAGAGRLLSVYLLLMLPLLTVVLAIAAAARRREVRILRAELPAIVAPDEVAVLVSLPARRLARRQARRAGGRRAQRAVRARQVAMTELAFERYRLRRCSPPLTHSSPPSASPGSSSSSSR
jgi:RsiW-degrading membrane proteinase PrsW (M82 family)